MQFVKHFLFVCLLVFCRSTKSQDEFDLIDSIYQEPQCATAGGLCVIAEDCPILSKEKGLCPKQSAKKVECCHGISRKETRCQKLGGECMSELTDCHRYELPKATDCYDQKCCLLEY